MRELASLLNLPDCPELSAASTVLVQELISLSPAVKPAVLAEARDVSAPRRLVAVLEGIGEEQAAAEFVRQRNQRQSRAALGAEPQARPRPVISPVARRGQYLALVAGFVLNVLAGPIRVVPDNYVGTFVLLLSLVLVGFGVLFVQPRRSAVAFCAAGFLLVCFGIVLLAAPSSGVGSVTPGLSVIAGGLAAVGGGVIVFRGTSDTRAATGPRA